MAARYTIGTSTNLDAGQICDALDYEFGVFWDDLRAPATAINPIGPVSAPSPDATTPGLLFEAGKDQMIYIVMQLPHTWKMGTSIYPHIHWEPATNNIGTVKWQLSYRWRNHGATAAALTDLTLLTLTTGGVANVLRYDAFDTISGDTKDISSMLQIALSRTGTADSFTGSARLLEFDIHYQVDSRGSRQERSKY